MEEDLSFLQMRGSTMTLCPGLRRASFVAGVLLLLPASAVPTAAQGPSGWSAGLGLGLGVDLGGGHRETNTLGLATQAAVLHHGGRGPGWGLQWDGAWFDGSFGTEKRFLLSAVVELPLGSGPLVLRTGPGVGMVTVVEVDKPEPGGVGDALVSIGDNGAWGAVVGVAGRLNLGAMALEPLADLVWERPSGIGEPGPHVFTLVVGGRLHLGG